MNGFESKEERESCLLWDAIFRDGPATIDELAIRTKLTKSRVTTLAAGEWFHQLGDARVYIATLSASGEIGVRLPAASLQGRVA